MKKTFKPNQMKCEVSDCQNLAISKRAISINNRPKAVLSLCEIHLDAADEDMVRIPVEFHNVDCFYKPLPVKEVILTGATEEECFIQFFKKNNQWKYCNGTYYKFKDHAVSKRYEAWLTIANYAKHGGDMW